MQKKSIVTIKNKDGRLLELSVCLSLGDARDVVLGPLDLERAKREDSGFRWPEGVRPDYEVYDNVLRIDYPKGTPADNRLFFNLKGHGVGNIEDHYLFVQADYFIERQSPLEGIQKRKGRRKWPSAVQDADGDFSEKPVEGTPLDFREETPIEELIRAPYEPLVRRRGYDHIYKLKKKGEDDGALSLAATLTDYAHTLKMEVYTNLSMLWVYSANGFSGKEIGKGGCIYPPRGGVLLSPIEAPRRSAKAMAEEGMRSDVAGFLSRDGRVEYRFYPIPQEFSKNVKGRWGLPCLREF